MSKPARMDDGTPISYRGYWGEKYVKFDLTEDDLAMILEISEAMKGATDAEISIATQLCLLKVHTELLN